MTKQTHISWKCSQRKEEKLSSDPRGDAPKRSSAWRVVPKWKKWVWPSIRPHSAQCQPTLTATWQTQGPTVEDLAEVPGPHVCVEGAGCFSHSLGLSSVLKTTATGFACLSWFIPLILIPTDALCCHLAITNGNAVYLKPQNNWWQANDKTVDDNDLYVLELKPESPCSFVMGFTFFHIGLNLDVLMV